MPGSLRKMPVWLPIVILLVAMASIQGGASLAKSLFPLVGAPGVTALRLALGTLILIAFFKPWRLRFAKEQRLPLLFYGVSLGGMNYLFYLSIQTVPLGIAVALEFTGPLAVAIGSLIAALIFVPIGALQAGEALWHWSVIPLGLAVAILSTALPYSLEMIALTRLPTRTFGTLMSMEPALAAVSGMIFLGETLTPIQLLALGAIIAASMGSTLTVRKESKIKELDIN